MNTCYVLSLTTFITLLIAFIQSFFNFHVFAANHLLFMVLVSIIYFATETLVIFFFVGTGVSIKEYTRENKLDTDYQKRSLAVKREVYPPLLLNMLLMIIVFIMVGAVDTHRLPGWIYQLTFATAIVHYSKVKVVQNDCFRNNTKIILDMSGVRIR